MEDEHVFAIIVVTLVLCTGLFLVIENWGFAF